MSCYKIKFEGIADEIRVPSTTSVLTWKDFLSDLTKTLNSESYTITKFNPSVKVTEPKALSDLVIVNLEDVAQTARELIGINTLRQHGVKFHFGNPFSHTTHNGVYKVFPTVKDAVKAYEEWLLGDKYLEVEPERRNWILELINSGQLYGKPLIYYTNKVPDNSYGRETYDFVEAPNHAHILLKLINAAHLQNRQKSWNRTSSNGYEVSTAGDSRFSALNAFLPNDENYLGKTIEDMYLLIKGSQKGLSPSKDSILNIENYNIFDDNIPDRVPEALRDKIYNFPNQLTKEDLEDFSYYMVYLPLWQDWAKENPELINELIELSAGKVLTDLFATTRVSLARALADIINEQINTDINNLETTQNTPEQFNSADESEKVLESPKTILSNAELKYWNENGVGEQPRILVASEHSDPVFHVNKILRVLNGEDTITERFSTEVSEQEYWQLPPSEQGRITTIRGKKQWWKTSQIIRSGRDFAGLYIITKHDGLPMLELLLTKIPKLIHFSITTLGGTKYEPGVMKYNDLLDRILDYITQGLDPNLVTIRIDPIVPGVTNFNDVEEVIRRCSEMGIKNFRFSIMDAYPMTCVSLAEIGYDFAQYYGNPKQIKESTDRYGNIIPAHIQYDFHAKKEVQDSIVELMISLSKKYNIKLGTCAEPLVRTGISKEGCLSVSAVNNMLGTVLEDLGTDNNLLRALCSCYGGKTDVLAYNSRCASHCFYCYAKHLSEPALRYYNEDGTLKENAFTQTRKTVNTPVDNTTESYSTWELYSGGARGADTMWSNIAKKYGIAVRHYSPLDYLNLSQEQKNEYEPIILGIIRDLGRTDMTDEYKRALVRRDLLQVLNADLILAVGTIDSMRDVVNGGTGYAVLRGILLLLPVYIYDLFSHTWKSYDYIKRKYVGVSEFPKITPHSAVIGSRDIPQSMEEEVTAIMEQVFSEINQIQPASDDTLIIIESTGSELLDKLNKYTTFVSSALSDIKPLSKYDIKEVFNIIKQKFDTLRIPIVFTTTQNIKELGLPENTEAAVLNGSIYVNEDIASISSPMHELMHLVFAVMKYENFDDFLTVMNTFRELPIFLEMLKKVQESDAYKNLLESEQLEEVFVRYLSDVLEEKIDTSDEFEQAYLSVLTLLNNYILKTFGVPPITDLISFLRAPLSQLTKYKSDLFIPKDFTTNGYADLKYKVDISGKLSAFISDLIKKQIIEKGDCI